MPAFILWGLCCRVFLHAALNLFHKKDNTVHMNWKRDIIAISVYDTLPGMLLS